MHHRKFHIVLAINFKISLFLVILWHRDIFFFICFYIIISGVFRGGIDVLVRAKLALSDGVNMQLTVRSQDPDVSELITSTIG